MDGHAVLEGSGVLVYLVLQICRLNILQRQTLMQRSMLKFSLFISS